MGAIYTLYATNKSFHNKVQKCAEIFGMSVEDMYGNYFSTGLHELATWERCNAVSEWLLEENLDIENFNFRQISLSDLTYCVDQFYKTFDEFIRSRLSEGITMAEIMMDRTDIDDLLFFYDVS